MKIIPSILFLLCTPFLLQSADDKTVPTKKMRREKPNLRVLIPNYQVLTERNPSGRKSVYEYIQDFTTSSTDPLMFIPETALRPKSLERPQYPDTRFFMADRECLRLGLIGGIRIHSLTHTQVPPAPPTIPPSGCSSFTEKIHDDILTGRPHAPVRIDGSSYGTYPIDRLPSTQPVPSAPKHVHTPAPLSTNLILLAPNIKTITDSMSPTPIPT